MTEAGGTLVDHGPLGGEDFARLCRAEVRVEGPGGAWTGRFASAIYDEPAGLYWDTEGLLVVTYGFNTYGLDARSGALRWSHTSATPIVRLLGSSRLAHVLVQAEIETFAIEADGAVAWRVAHSDVVTDADLVGGRLVLTSSSPRSTARSRPSTRRLAATRVDWLTGCRRAVAWGCRVDNRARLREVGGQVTLTRPGRGG